MSRSAWIPPLPVGRQGTPINLGGQIVSDEPEAHTVASTAFSGRGPIRVALVAEDVAGAITAIGGVPLLASQVVIIWRVDNTEAQRGLRSGDYDFVTHSKAIAGTDSRDVQTWTYRRSEIWKGLDDRDS